VLTCSFSYEVARVGVGGLVCRSWVLFSSLSSPKKYNLTIFVVDISTSVFNLLIFSFYS